MLKAWRHRQALESDALQILPLTRSSCTLDMPGNLTCKWNNRTLWRLLIRGQRPREQARQSIPLESEPRGHQMSFPGSPESVISEDSPVGVKLGPRLQQSLPSIRTM